jgi:hypothetical protein
MPPEPHEGPPHGRLGLYAETAGLARPREIVLENVLDARERCEAPLGGDGADEAMVALLLDVASLSSVGEAALRDGSRVG